MEKSTASDEIAVLLSGTWEIHRTPKFTEHLQTTFGDIKPIPANFDCIYIAQAAEGDVTDGIIGGMITQWWRVDDSGLERISNPDLPRFPNEPENLRSCFYIKPVVKFFVQDRRITIGEAFGPNLRCRKVGVLCNGPDHLDLNDVKVKWVSSEL